MAKVVYCCSDKMFDCLYLSILSIVRRTKLKIDFFVLSGDFSDINPLYVEFSNEHINALNEVLTKYSNKCTLTFITANEKDKKIIIDNALRTKRFSYNSLPIFLDNYPFFTSKVLYLNPNTMACGDIAKFFDYDTKDFHFIVSHNEGKYGFLDSKDNFNNNVILFDADNIKNSKVLAKCRNEYNVNRSFKTLQEIFNHISLKFDYFDDEFKYNRQSNSIKKGDIIKSFYSRFNKFYRNVKQFDISVAHKNLKLDEFKNDYKIYRYTLKSFVKAHHDESFISVKHLRKSYGDIKAVDDISFEVKKGTLFAFLGVNGAGKSTTINIISSTLIKDSGDISVDSFDLVKDNTEVKKRIGIVFQNSVLDDILTVEDNLKIRAKFYNLKKDVINSRINYIVKLLKLEPLLKQQVNKLSGGQRRRVDIARALIHEPKLLMLDEPTTGLDPKTRIDVWNLINEIRERTKMTVFLTTHYLEEAEKATYVVIMDKGKIIAEGTPNELKNKYSSDYVIAYKKKDNKFEKLIKDYPFKYDFDLGGYRISVKNSKGASSFLIRFKSYVDDFEVIKGNMDDVFLNVTGQNHA